MKEYLEGKIGVWIVIGRKWTLKSYFNADYVHALHLTESASPRILTINIEV